jgi:hypothetical protein
VRAQLEQQRPQNNSKPKDSSTSEGNPGQSDAAVVHEEAAPAEPPQSLEIDFTPELYEKIKADMLKNQHPLVRPYLLDFIEWLKKLDPIVVYDALEKGETVKTFYDRERWSPYRMGAAAARGLLKASKRLRERASKTFNIKLARLVLRFENPEVYDLLREFDPAESYLNNNIDDFKKILGLVEEPKT